MKKMLTFAQVLQATPSLCDPIDSDHETSISSIMTQRCEIATESIRCSGLDTKGPSQYEENGSPQYGPSFGSRIHGVRSDER